MRAGTGRPFEAQPALAACFLVLLALGGCDSPVAAYRDQPGSRRDPRDVALTGVAAAATTAWPAFAGVLKESPQRQQLWWWALIAVTPLLLWPVAFASPPSAPGFEAAVTGD